MIASKVHATLLPFYLCALLISCGGGDGDDTIVIDSINFLIVRGGSGNDILRLAGDGISLDLSALANGQLTDVEQIDLSADGASMLSVAATEVLSLSSETDILVVTGDADDELLFSDVGWMLTGQTMIDGWLFNVYMNLNAVVQVEADIIQGP